LIAAFIIEGMLNIPVSTELIIFVSFSAHAVLSELSELTDFMRPSPSGETSICAAIVLKNYPTFHEPRRFITVFIRALH
jgi:hypothetical protein